MNRDLEKKFVDQFIVKNKRERLWYELSGKKRTQGISRFCHRAEDMLVANAIIQSGNDLYAAEIRSVIQRYISNQQAYILAFQKEIDQLTCDLSMALELVLGNGMAAVILLDGMAVIETEQSRGTPMRYILCGDPNKLL